MKKKRNNKIIIMAIVGLVALLIIIGGTTYATVILAKLPIDLPFRKAEHIQSLASDNSQVIIDGWKDPKWYQSKTEEKVEEIIKDTVVEEVTEKQFKGDFSYIEPASLEKYLVDHPEALENGYEKLFIDKVDLMNTPTGIKSIYGDDVLAVDAVNGITIIGKDVNSSTGTSKVKVAIVNNSKQLDVSLSKDLNYWDVIGKHVVESESILGINASNYTWNSSGNYAALFGTAKYHGTTYRKVNVPESLIGFTEDGNMMLGGNIESAYNAFEFGTRLIKDKVIADGLTLNNQVDTVAGDDKKPEGMVSTSDGDRYAQAAVGQNSDGTTFLVVASGGVYGSGLGVTPSDIASILMTYQVDNAVTLSGGSRAIMRWNGRTVNETVGYDSEGVKLPNAIVVKPNLGNKVETVKEKDTTTETGAEAGTESGEAVKNPEATPK